MNQALTPAGENAVSELSSRYGISTDAVRTMLDAVNNGRGSMAQFNIPELGGSGQWMRGGMTMVGNMFDHGLKSRVDGLCRDLSAVLSQHQVYPPRETGSSSFGGSSFGGGSWWPSDLGAPSSSGGQNGSQYAVFPGSRRLAVLVGGELAVYDTLDHSIGGVQQQQGGGPGSLEFTSQYGTFTAGSLPRVDQQSGGTNSQNQSTPQPAPQTYAQPSSSQQSSQSSNQSPRGNPSGVDISDITAAIEALAGLHAKGFLTDDEFHAKKSELLGRV
ncbi:MAG: SHOCT domain-containing protein [Rhodococcus sp. (in: high G+C Gram-positive bacteria)]|nr:SHOCT domain-containing protein [Rhodococcus sp. (in: high G+C Gram-positive bacteria)]MDI6626694.1 SHOCT domain-containing protein [Rhodococcus sp. (in: high G+C Gram-positive bacteria)]